MATIGKVFSGVGKVKITLTFWSYDDVANDNTIDARVVDVSSDGFNTMTSTTLPNVEGKKTWQQVAVDLSAFAGKNFQIRFRFDTKGLNKVLTQAGWFVDDVSVQ